MKPSLAERLSRGNKHSLGEADAIVREALAEPALVRELVACLKFPDDLVRSRAANVLKKVVVAQPNSLHPFARFILRAALDTNPLPAQWNLTLVLGRLALQGCDRALAVDLLFEHLQSSSVLLRTCCMQSLTDLAVEDHQLKERIVPLLQEFTRTGSAAMRARGRKLLKRLGIEGAESIPSRAQR